MFFGIIIQARTGSKRFPAKVLNKIDHRSVLEYLIDNLINYFPRKKIFVATTKLKRDDRIVNIVKKKKINFYRGSENNVLKRYLDCSIKFNLKNIIHITSDCPLIDPILIKKMKKEFISQKLDYYANTCPPNKSKYPDGTDIEIYSFNSLKKVFKIAKKKEDKEHVTNFFWKNPEKFKINILNNKKNISNYKFSIDYKNDLHLVKKIVKILNAKKLKGNANNIVNIIKNNKRLKRISETSRSKYAKNRKDLFSYSNKF